MIQTIRSADEVSFFDGSSVVSRRLPQTWNSMSPAETAPASKMYDAHILSRYYFGALLHIVWVKVNLRQY